LPKMEKLVLARRVVSELAAQLNQWKHDYSSTDSNDKGYAAR